MKEDQSQAPRGIPLNRGFVQRGAEDMMTRANRGCAKQLHIVSRGIPQRQLVTALARGFVQRGTVDTEMSDRAGLTGRSLNDDNTAKTQQ